MPVENANGRTVFHSIAECTVQLAKKLQSVNADRGTPIVVKDMSHPARGHISCFYVFMSCK